MEFIILSPELNNPRESYSFDLDYPEDENDHSMTFSGTKVTNVESTKGQLIKLIRSLIQFSNTLEELPKERVINIKVSVTMFWDRWFLLPAVTYDLVYIPLCAYF